MSARGIAQSVYYSWSMEFLAAGKRRLAGDTARAVSSDEVRDLRREALALKECVEEAKARTATVEIALQERRKSMAVVASRKALLSALDDLGYELTEGMATAWAAEGRLVLRSGSRPDYGVEVSGADRVQMKPVAFERGGVGPDAARDRDAETIWCGDVSRLQATLSEHGGALQIERALPIGAVPLKRVAIAPEGDQTRVSAPSLRSKILR